MTIRRRGSLRHIGHWLPGSEGAISVLCAGLVAVLVLVSGPVGAEEKSAADTAVEDRSAGTAIAPLAEGIAMPGELSGPSRPAELSPGLRKIQESADWAAWETEADTAQSLMDRGGASDTAMNRLRQTLDNQRRGALRISVEAEKEIAALSAERDALGQPPEDGSAEPAEIITARAELDARLAATRALKGRADQVVARAVTLLKRLETVSQQRLLDRLASRGPTPLNPVAWFSAGDVAAEGWARGVREVSRAVSSPAERARLVEAGPGVIIAIVIAFVVLVGLRRFVLGFLLRRAAGTASRSNLVMYGVAAAFTRFFTLLTAIFGILIAVLSLDIFGPVSSAVIEGMARGLLYLAPAYTLGAAIFAPRAAQLRIARVEDDKARTGMRATMLLGLSMLLFALFAGLVETVPATRGAETVGTFIVVAIGAIGLFGIASVGRPTEGFWHFARYLGLSVAVVTFALALAGYDFAARFLFLPFLNTLIVFVACFLIYRVVSELVEIRVEGRGDEAGLRIRLLPTFVGLLLICAAGPVVALIWGATTDDLADAWQALSSGLSVGEIKLSPVDFLVFGIVFAVGYVLTRGLKQVMGSSVLPNAGVSKGASDALVSGIGYVGFFLAGLAAIGATGIDLSNLAIVAGALSVGIGFGLQNVVNNFVSGLILLIERPIKVGDWIEVGGVHGTVQKVKVRSTEIETFDGSSYIIPNSDLISSPVTNFTHSNHVGRVINKVGVAYGTDARLVERLLLEVACEHPMILASPPPAALFMNFGADSLEFELRAFLRDVNWIIAVKSDLNFKISERFTENGIEIPFSQRDIHIRSIGDLGDVIKEKTSPKDEEKSSPQSEVKTLDAFKPEGPADGAPDAT